MPVAVTVACKCLAAHTTAEWAVLEVLCLVQAVFEPVITGVAAVAASVAAPSTRPLTATVCSQLVFSHQVHPAQRAADPFVLDRACAGCQLGRAILFPTPSADAVNAVTLRAAYAPRSSQRTSKSDNVKNNRRLRVFSRDRRPQDGTRRSRDLPQGTASFE